MESDRASAVPAPDPSVPGGDLRERGAGEGIDGEGEDEHGAGGDGGHPGQGVPDRAEVCGRIQGAHEDRVRRDPAEVELQGSPGQVMTSGSYRIGDPNARRGSSGSQAEAGDCRLRSHPQPRDLRESPR